MISKGQDMAFADFSISANRMEIAGVTRAVERNASKVLSL